MANSIEEQVEGYYKNLLKSLGVRHYAKTEEINSKITEALKNSVSKGGGSGMNYPDIKLLLENSNRRDIPVMIEVKGSRGKLEKLDKNGEIVGVTLWASDGKVGKDGKLTHAKGDPNYNVVKGFAVNGAMHYGFFPIDILKVFVNIVLVVCEVVDEFVVISILSANCWFSFAKFLNEVVVSFSHFFVLLAWTEFMRFHFVNQ